MENEEKNKISIDDFKKIEIKVGEILSAEAVEDADKLYKFMVDLGLKPSADGSTEEKDIRQILSAIREYFPSPEELVGKKLLFVTNLEPRKIRGLESNGMLFAVGDEKPVFVVPEVDVPNGSKAR
ncbi:methionine--tRNA ligase subunit beta [Candidatus Nomurabacteria bacterium]|nr:methionine--tRNA ligase subunit beta [Candidatus Nomurabacteria bacterium]